MLTIKPVAQALIPRDSAAAQKVIAPNYDEFQGDHEIWSILRAQPESILQVTMSHCAVPQESEILEEGSDAALTLAARNLDALKSSSMYRIVPNALLIYQIEDVRRPGLRQIGLLGSAQTSEIRTDKTPAGTIIRNEGIRESKARGRADLITATACFTEIVNNAVEDPDQAFAKLLEQFADRTEPSFVALDERRNRHSMWLITDTGDQQVLQAALNSCGVAYVADGNHRSAAAAMLGKPEFLAVFFTTPRMGIFPYNRLVEAPQLSIEQLLAQLSPAFVCKVLDQAQATASRIAPHEIHSVALYSQQTWIALQVRPELYLEKPAAEQIDAALVQQHILDAVFGLADAKDERITYVGGNKDAAYLAAQVDAGHYQYALSLAPVEMQQFVAVCRENSFMPPKSTWFEPKVRSGLVMSVL